MKRAHVRLLALAMTVAMSLTLFTGCGQKEQAPAPAPDTNTTQEVPEAPAPAETDRSNWPKYLGLAAGGASSQTGIVGAVLAPALTEYLDISEPVDGQRRHLRSWLYRHRLCL